ncbi:adenine nucleotide alpha hydrolase [Pseudorhodoplanes sp.]|uniref:adenine nucleotide alpha hydrolase n=1 Tax=Pseudorhodoplanes sp. TaxID=1934341 RepID=UPI00391AF529
MPITDMLAERIGLAPVDAGPAKAVGAHNDRLHEVLRRYDNLAVAVSGGIDSMTLGFIAHRLLPREPLMVHAVSPAVPAEATLRIRDYAAREGWRLSLVDAGEFADPSYRANPVDRCYFCKSNLYERIQGLSFGVIASGTNLDDLGDFRPGLKAAAERNVVHPFVEAGIGKSAIRELARLHGLTDLAELPAQPCLASRVETGIRIEADDLAFIDAVERQIREHLPVQANVRCRLTRHGVVLEVGGPEGSEPGVLAARAAQLCEEAGRDFLGVKPYRQGSAFLRSSDQTNDFANRN